MAVNIYLNGLRVASATSFEYTKKKDNNKELTFDGYDISEAEHAEYTVKLSRMHSYDPNYEADMESALQGNIPIVIEDKTITYTFHGCYLSDESGKRDPKSKMKLDLSFDASSMEKE